MARDEVPRFDRRRLLQGGVTVAGVGLLAGCGLAPLPDLWGHGPRRIGYLGTGTSISSEANLAAFRAGLAELGYGAGEGFILEPRYADGRAEALPALAAELAALPVD